MVLRKRFLLAIGILLGIGAFFGWSRLHRQELPPGFARSNGRIEAVEVDIATQTAGRLDEILVKEGDLVTNRQVLARMDIDVLAAQIREADADLRRARSAVETARSIVLQREGEKAAAGSVVAQREVDFDLARRHRDRTETLAQSSAVSAEDQDKSLSAFLGARAALDAAKAHATAADAAITSARSQVIQAESSVDAIQSRIERLQTDLEDRSLKSPRDGRVQYLIAQAGEVLNQGGRALNLVDLSDVYMTFFLPTVEAGRVQIGAEVYLILDTAPDYAIPARVSFVADVAQFTPKTVETAVEREKLMFRVRARIDPEILRRHLRTVKPGLPGMAYVRLEPGAEWPEFIRSKRVP